MNTHPNTAPAQDDNHISTVRAFLIESMRDVRQAKSPEDVKMAIDKAKAVSLTAGAITNLVRVEADHANAAGSGAVAFLESKETMPRLSQPAQGTLVHRIR